jgi:hypothetical protein
MIDIAFLFCTFIFNLFDIFCFGVYKDSGASDSIISRLLPYLYVLIIANLGD